VYLNAKNAKTVRKACEEKVKWKDGDGMSLAPCITAQKKRRITEASAFSNYF
jgi:hypothetical protein